jgi:hypothetical protein
MEPEGLLPNSREPFTDISSSVFVSYMVYFLRLKKKALS